MPKPKNPDLSALVEKAKKGDTHAFGEIYDALVTPIYRYIYYRVDSQVAEDLTEETFLKTWNSLKQYKQGKHPFSSWVFRIAHNLICDYYRKNQPLSEVDENMADPQEYLHPERTLNIKFNEIKLKKAIKELPQNYQEVIVLKYINEADNETIAKTIGKTEGAVRTLQFRALKQLRTLLGEKSEDF